MIAALILFYIGAVVSAFASSSSAVLGSAIPLAVPFLQADTGVSAVGFIAGMAVAATIADVVTAERNLPKSAV